MIRVFKGQKRRPWGGVSLLWGGFGWVNEALGEAVSLAAEDFAANDGLFVDQQADPDVLLEAGIVFYLIGVPLDGLPGIITQVKTHFSLEG